MSRRFLWSCSELCGAAHGFMPIVVQGVSFHVFVNWLRESAFVE